MLVQTFQQPGGHGVGLADMAEVNARRKEPSVDGAYGRRRT